MIGLVCTSIGDGRFIKGYCDEIYEHVMRDEVNIYVVSDLKTPATLGRECAHWFDEGFNVYDLDVPFQDDFLDKLGIKHLIPYNSDNRRNVGYLRAIEAGCDTIISIDDDNFCRKNSNFFLKHNVSAAKGKWNGATVNHASGFYNVCADLERNDLYPRGFPYSQRNSYSKVFANKSRTETFTKLAVNVGLWDEDPDLDAMTWLNNSHRTKEHVHDDSSHMLGQHTWMPINSQNTAVLREAMPAYYFLPMGGIINGMKIDRFGDIFQGYFLEKCVKSMNDAILFGTPVVQHVRNSHNYMNDAQQEMACIAMLEDMLPWLVELRLDSGFGYAIKYRNLSYEIEDQVEKFKGSIWTQDAKSFWHRAAYCMRQWLQACKSVGQ